MGSSTLSTFKNRIYQLIAMNPVSIARVVVLDAFAADSPNKKARVDKMLAKLVAEEKIIRDGRRGYRAVQPWADIAYAVIGQEPERKSDPVPVQLLNAPDDLGVSVAMTKAEYMRQGLQEGDRVVVGLVRGAKGHTGLRARFIAPAPEEKPFHLVGIFNQSARQFKALDQTIKTDFLLAREPNASATSSQFLVELPIKFDIRNPLVNVLNDDQPHDVQTDSAISWIVASNHDVSHAHPEDVLREAKCFGRAKLNIEGRVDLRHLDLVTVDPPGAKDLDDGFAVETGADGYALYTAIADVAAVIPYKSAVDREAYARGVTYYLRDHTSHMLPDVLSTRKCSLLENQDRLAIVVKQNLGWDCVLKDFEVMAAVVRSRDQLTYGQFYDLIEQDDPRFRAISTIHNTRRQTMNAELKAYLKDQGAFTTKSIVETLMVQTNSLCAQFLKSASVPFLSRNFEQGAQKNGQRAYYASYHLGHANLHLLHYAHMTSPIRRYADLLNMRAIHKALGNKHIGISDEEIAGLDSIAHHLNERRRVERKIAYDIHKYHAVRDLLHLQGSPVRIEITDISKDSIEVMVPHIGVRQQLPASSLPANQWRIDGGKQQLVLLDDNGQETRRYSRGEAVLGQLYEIDPGRARWKVRLVPQDQALRPSATSSSTPKP